FSRDWSSDVCSSDLVQSDGTRPDTAHRPEGWPDAVVRSLRAESVVGLRARLLLIIVLGLGLSLAASLTVLLRAERQALVKSAAEDRKSVGEGKSGDA